MKDIKILIATHKKYEMPTDDIYLPIHVGAKEQEELGYQKDNEGKNISEKNPYYCELTAIYWAWKNLKSEYIGLSHYRRHLTCSRKIPKRESEKFKVLLNRKQSEEILERVNIILPQKRKYYIENLYSHYKHTGYIESLDETGKIIEEKYPSYVKEFELLKVRTSAHMFNIFIMKQELFEKYCTWLFDILFELEKRIDPKQYNSFHARYLGRISELLLDVWINTNNLKYEEVKLIDIEKVNWLKKGIAFLRAKFTGKKYEGSF